MKKRLFPFREHVHFRIVGTKSCDGLLPELKRNLTCHVATEAVDTALHPETHCIRHALPYILVLVIEVGCIRPVSCKCSIAFGITLIPLRSTLSCPYCIRRSVVRNPVDNDAESESVCLGHEIVEILECAEFRIDSTVIPYCII